MAAKACNLRGRPLRVYIETIEGLYVDDEISVRPGRIALMRETTLHELLHAAVKRLRLRRCFRSQNAEEKAVEVLARALARAFTKSNLRYKSRLLLPRYTKHPKRNDGKS